MRRVIALIAAALLALTMAGPVAADPINKAQFPHVYVTTCADRTVVPDQNAHNVPGWDIDWAPGDTPWLLLGYTVVGVGVGTFTYPHPPGLVGNGKLFGPCTITWGDPAWSITDAYFLQR